MTIRKDAEEIINHAIQSVMPDEAVRKALTDRVYGSGKIYLVAVGKAAWQMTKTAMNMLQEKVEVGICITKYTHVKAEIPRIICYEAGHPIPDENSFTATQEVLNLVCNLNEEDTVIFLLSGGGSALFEKPLISGTELLNITNQLLSCGADIMEINTIRKRLSAVKGGRFAKICEPAKVFSIILSDILGDPLDMIASGPTCSDTSTSEQALAIIRKYHLKVSNDVMQLMQEETPKNLKNVENIITGSVRDLCRAAADSCITLGYEPIILTDQLTCEAKEAGAFLAAIAKSYQRTRKSIAFIAGGETVVHLNGNGRGGRNQELALASAVGISGLKNTAVFSVGSDGTDGPTDAAGGYCDNNTKEILDTKEIDIYQTIRENNAYFALKETGGLIFTGPTGTNVNDVSVLLIKR